MTQNQYKTRIFWIEDDSKFLDDWIEIFRNQKFSDFELIPYIVKHDEWKKEALAAIQDARPHLAIIDLRLESKKENRDVSGLEFLRDIKVLSPAIEIIVCSSFLGLDLAEEITELGAKYFAKASQPLKLVEKIKEGASQSSALFGKRKIDWPSRWSREAILKQLLEDKFTTFDDKLYYIVDDLVHQLHKEDDGPLGITHLEGKLSQMPAPLSFGRSVVAKIKRKNKAAAYVLKLTTAERIQQERDCYKKYIDGNVPGFFHTHLRNTTIFWDVGASIYSFIGNRSSGYDSYLTFFENTDDNEDLISPVKNFFNRIWPSLQKKEDNQRLYTAYDSAFDLENKINRFQIDSLNLPDEIRLRLRCPLAWVRANKSEINFDIGIGLVHGDFHGDNIFTDGTHLWVIDFERSGPHHNMRDFCELEADLFARCLDEAVSLKEAVVLAARLVGFSHPNTTVEIKIGHKLVGFSQDLRMFARDFTRSANVQEYDAAMLLHLVYMAMRKWTPEELPERQRAWIYASLICERLEAGRDKKLPPSLAPFFEDPSLFTPVKGDGKSLISQLTKQLRVSFTDLRVICPHFNVNYQDLGEGGVTDKVVILVNHIERHGRLDELYDFLYDEYPHVFLE